jgi:FtsP/CotA-like multicopper oxidase with cupredoxin domain
VMTVEYRRLMYIFQGTFWYHSHYKAQTCDGLRGPLVIYDQNDPHRRLYDVDDGKIRTEC